MSKAAQRKVSSYKAGFNQARNSGVRFRISWKCFFSESFRDGLRDGQMTDSELQAKKLSRQLASSLPRTVKAATVVMRLKNKANAIDKYLIKRAEEKRERRLSRNMAIIHGSRQ